MMCDESKLFRSSAAHAADQATFDAVILRLDVGLEGRTLSERKDHFVVIALDDVAPIDEISGGMSGNGIHAAARSAFASCTAAARTARAAARSTATATAAG